MMTKYNFLKCSTLFLALLLIASGEQLDNSVRSTVIESIRWKAYWAGLDSLGTSYPAGRQIDARVINTKSRVYVFLAQIKTEIDFQPGERPNVSIRTLSEITNDAAVKDFVSSRSGPGCVGPAQSSSLTTPGGTDKDIPIGRICPSLDPIIRDLNFTFILPRLLPPRAILNKKIPADGEKLLTTVRNYIESRREYCSGIAAKIPYYSNSDPYVHVLLAHAGECPKGIATFGRMNNGDWSLGKFIADVPKEQLFFVIERISSNVALIVRDR